MTVVTPTPQSIARRARWLRDKYGITLAEFAAILKVQGGTCAICRKPPRAGRNLHVDHDHKTGEVRGLLCYNCNRFHLGRKRDAEVFMAMYKYLTDPPARRVLVRPVS